MTGFPHPFVMATVAEQRRADFQAQADRDRLARSVQPNAGHRQRVTDLVTGPAVALVLVLLLAALHVA